MHLYAWIIDWKSSRNIAARANPIIEAKFDNGITTIHGNGAPMCAIVLFVILPEQNGTIKF